MSTTTATDTAAADTAPATPTARKPNSYISDYTDLVATVRAAGLMERRRGRYWARIAVLALLFAGAGVLLVVVGQSWWQLGVAALFGVLFTQVAFLSHDAAHRQVFDSGKHNMWLSIIAGNFVVGLSYGWWMNKHSRHHGNPNTIGKDGDIKPGALVFTPEDAEQRTGLPAWFAARQGWFFFPLLTLAGLGLHIDAVTNLVTGKNVKHRKIEFALLAVRLIGFPVLLISLLGPAIGLSFLAVQVIVFGVYMGSSFAPNHKGMPLIPAGVKVDYLRRQTLTSRNIRGGKVVDVAMGGLNYQIEHHLFPGMPSANLPKAGKIAREYCDNLGVAYTETGLVESYAIVIRYLNRVGLGHADPFECPLAGQLRTA